MSIMLLITTIDENERGIESSRCRTAELIAGLTILCTGDKSDKLAVAFDAFDRENQGTLSRYDLIRFLRSFVSTYTGTFDRSINLFWISS